MNNKKIRWIVFPLWLLIAPQLWATTVTYDAMNIAGNTWQYTYNVTNDTLGQDIGEFTIFFDVNLYQNLTSAIAPVDWDPLVIQPDPVLPDDGFYDALALVAGLPSGNSLTGFSVVFDFLGAGTPGDQTFSVIDPITFATLDSGFTQATAVPVPAAFWLFGSGLLGLLGAGTRRFREHH